MIQMLVDNESDLYNPYDPSRTRINEEVYHYLKTYCSPLESAKHTNDTLQIITDSPIDKDRFQGVLQAAVSRDIAEFDMQIARNNRRVIWEGIVGVLLIALGITLSVYLDELILTMV